MEGDNTLKNVLSGHKGRLSWLNDFVQNLSDVICGHLRKDFKTNI
jgi:hypothetical protein